MTDLTFVVNGTDFSNLVHKYGYQTDLVPVYSRSVTTLDGIEHQKLLRSKGVLTVTLNPVSEELASAFSSALRKLPATVKYHSFQLGAVVAQSMRITGMPFELKMQKPGVKWLDGLTITFEQL